MGKERWVYKNGKLVGKNTTYTRSDGSKEIVKQKAYTGILGGRHATDVTSRIKFTKQAAITLEVSTTGIAGGTD